MDTVNRKTSLMIGVVLLLIALCFVGYAVHHPEAAFPWSNKVTFMLYGMYAWLLFKFLLDIPLLQKISKMPSRGSLARAAIFLLLAVLFLIMEISGGEADVYTILRGFVVIGGMDIAIGSFSVWMKQKRGRGRSGFVKG